MWPNGATDRHPGRLPDGPTPVSGYSASMTARAVQTVTSEDGTPIAFEREGSGPPLILIGGALSDRSAGAGLLPLLADRFTAYAIDRRGRGASGDHQPYAVEREIEDIGALLAEAGSEAFVYGHSSGAILALKAAIGGLPIRRLIVYEPPYLVAGDRSLPRPNLEGRVRDRLAAGDRQGAVRLFLAEGPGVPPPVIDQLLSSPAAAALEALAHTLPYDIRIADDIRPPPVQLATLAIPTLVLEGGASPNWIRAVSKAIADALPISEIRELPGLGHNAPAEVLAPIIGEFLGDA